ncbi:MAG: hypothetical protein JNM12_09985 [Alphaproteobacteria bacterium]|nr:hypothetical protein [Alphaproteobacteria bacterium]
MRKLLSIRIAAAKLGHSYTWFLEHRKELQARGFPRPVLSGALGRDRYDEAAIDAWLDAQMDPALRAQPDSARVVASFPAYDQILEQRLQRNAT